MQALSHLRLLIKGISEREPSIKENLSGMGVTADVISDGLDMMKNLGYTANIEVVKDPETGKPGIEVNKNWYKTK